MPDQLSHPAGVGELSFNERLALQQAQGLEQLTAGSFPSQVANLQLNPIALHAILDDPVIRSHVLRLNSDPSPELVPISDPVPGPGDSMPNAAAMGENLNSAGQQNFGVDTQTAPIPVPQGGPLMVMGGAIVVPRLITAIRVSGTLRNAAAAGGIRGLAGNIFGSTIVQRGLNAMGLIGVVQLIPGIGDLFGASAEDEMASLIEELTESGYIRYTERSGRDGQPRPMTHVVIPIDPQGTAYGLPYRPLSWSNVNEHDKNQDTYRRPRQARRSVRTARTRR